MIMGHSHAPAPQLNQGASPDTMSAAGVSTASLMSGGSGGAGDRSGRESPTAFFCEKGAKVEWQTSNHLSKTKDLLESAEERKCAARSTQHAIPVAGHEAAARCAAIDRVGWAGL